MTLTVIEGHFYVYFNFYLRSYGQLFDLVFINFIINHKSFKDLILVLSTL